MSSLQQLILETLQGRVLTESKKKVTIHKDTLVVDVQRIVNLSDRNLTKIPFKFGVVIKTTGLKYRVEIPDISVFRLFESKSSKVLVY